MYSYKSKKSSTIFISMYEARAGTALATDYKSVVRLFEQLQALESTNKCGFLQFLSPFTRKEHICSIQIRFCTLWQLPVCQQPLEGQQPCMPTSVLSCTNASVSSTRSCLETQASSPTEVAQEEGLGQH